MTLLYTDSRFRQHITGSHPEHPQRLVAVDAHLKQAGLVARCNVPQWQPATTQQLERVHDPHYVEHIQRYAAAGGGRIEADTVVSERSYEVAALGLDRVLIVDWDVHHGNGTQETFWEDDRVGFLSIHRWPFYPGTGDDYETGTGRGLRWISNVPVAFGTPRHDFHDCFERALLDLAAKVQPQLVLISAGFDAHREDPIGSLELEAEDFIRLTKTALAVAREYAGGRTISLLEGGYNPQRLAECVEVHLSQLLAGRPT